MGKKKHARKLAMGALCLVLLMASCGKAQGSDGQQGGSPAPTGEGTPDISPTPAPTAGQEGDLPQGDGPTQGDSLAQEAGLTQGDAPTQGAAPTQGGGMSQRLDDGGLPQEREGKEPAGKAFGELPVVGEEDAVYCNEPENLTNIGGFLPVCRDPLYGILYYVDYGGDGMIHAVRDGQEEVVLEMSGTRLFCRGGKLYFLYDPQAGPVFAGVEKGNVLSYDPVDGSVETVLSGVFDYLIVYQDVIYCATKVGEKDGCIISERQVYSFGTGELQPWPENLIPYGRHGGDFLVGVMEPTDPDDPDARVDVMLATGPAAEARVELYRWDTGEGAVLEGLRTAEYGHKFTEGDYFIELTRQDGSGVYHTYHIPTRQDEAREVQVDEEGTLFLLGGRIYNGAYDSTASFTDIETGDYASGPVLYSERVQAGILEFYTDGESLYACVFRPSGDGRMLLDFFRVRVDEDGRRDFTSPIQSYADKLNNSRVLFWLEPVAGE